jgi:hypothetical protein
MINYKRLAIVAAVFLAVIASLFLFIPRPFVWGLLLGYLTGAINFAAIVLTVKTLFKEPEGNKVLPAILIYITKIAVICAVLVALIMFRKHYDFKGFLVGFTISLLILIAENGMVLFVLKRK